MRFTLGPKAILLLLSLCMVAPACAETVELTGRKEVVAEIADLFGRKEVVTAEEGAAFKAKAAALPPGRDLSELALLLVEKGEITEEQQAGLEHRVDNARLPGGDIEAFVDYLRVLGVVSGEEADEVLAKLAATPLGKEKEYYERIAAYVEREVRREVEGILRKQIKEEVVQEAKQEAKKAVPDWATRLRFSGDVRVRYQADLFDEANALFLRPDRPTEIMNSRENRQRVRLRGRLNLTAKVNDEVDAVLGIATGGTSDPVSTNVTFGDSFNKKPIALDLGYIKWKPMTTLTMWGGRMPSPWFSTDLVWDSDLNFDGIAGTWTAEATPSVSTFVTAGAFPLQEVELSSRDKWLLGAQAGIQFKTSPRVSGNIGVAFYDFINITGKTNDPDHPGEFDFTAPQFQQKGNTLMDIDPSATAIKTALASDFRELNVTASIDFAVADPIHIVFMGDYVTNLGFEKEEVSERAGFDVEEETTGYQVGMAVGHPNVTDKGAWKAYLFYRYLEADAVVDAFTDSDFHLGGTNAEGVTLGGDVGLGKNFWLSARWMSANEISGPPLSIDVFQFNVNAKF